MVVGFWRFHRWLYRVTGGRVGERFGAAGHTLLLTTTGRKSGEPRHVTLTFVEDGGRYLVIASNAGEPTHPQWFLNLSANPDVTVQIGRRRFAATATVVDQAEADRIFGRFVSEIEPGYQTYRERTDRPIPVVALLPAN